MMLLLCLLLFSGFLPKVSTESTDKLVFRPLMHQPRIYAGAPPGVHVTTVHAYDPDRPRKKVEYNLPNVFDYKTFVIDQLSGNLTTAKQIDRDVGEIYEVMVAAVSHGSSELEHLQIIVTEFNQFAPRFGQRTYFIEMHPKTPVNTSLLQVKATDPDPAPHNAEIYYKMDQNVTSKHFSLNSFTGDLTLMHSFNGTANNLHFGIFAEDGGSPKRWDYVPVYVILKNISAPSNVHIVRVTHAYAVICWEEPFYGDILGYGISYYSKNMTTPKVVNVTVDYDMDLCEDIPLDEDTEYVVQVYGWNEIGKGVLSPPLDFRTPESWCKSFLCQAGTCETLIEEPWYKCHCPPGYYGKFCEFFNACVTNPCGTNGYCYNTTNNEYICTCNEGYSGQNCDYYNPCLRNPDLCENGGTCFMSSNNAYKCICPEGFYGDECERRNPCVLEPCNNSATCVPISDDTFQCLCPPGFAGETCEIEFDYCASFPCAEGSTCVNNRENYTCICAAGFSGDTCDLINRCPEEKTAIDGGWYFWNETKHGSVVLIKCPSAPLQSLKRDGFLKRRCLLSNFTAVWGDIDASECDAKIIPVDEVADELHNITRNPQSLDTETLQAAAEGIEAISSYANKDKKLAQGIVDVISNVMEVNDTVIDQTDSSTFDSLLQTIDEFASNVELKPGECLTIAAENVRIQSLEWHPEIGAAMHGDHIELTAPIDKGTVDEEVVEKGKSTPLHPTATSEDASSEATVIEAPPEKTKPPLFQVFVPKEALEEAHRQLEKSVRLKFVVYYNDKLFQSKKSSRPLTDGEPSGEKRPSDDIQSRDVDSDDSSLRTPVLQISVGNVSLTNLYKPLVYILPMTTKRRASCVYWDEKEKIWSIKGLQTKQITNKVICQSSHMTAFSVLLDFTPDDQPSETHNLILSIASYIGSTLSILGLILTISTYSLFKCLNRDHPGKILLNLCFSLLMMNTTFLVGSSSLAKKENVCAAVAILTHYFVLTSLSWMCAEAINMRHLLVHVFASSETHFMLKRFCLAWGIPFIIVCATASVKFEAYRNKLICMLSSQNPWVYYFSFLGPSCIILFANLIIFLRVSRVIFTPKLAVRTSPTHTRKVTVAQVRGAFTVMVLLGVTWVFGTMTFGKVKVGFQYLFCISNSLQGFSIFMVRCLLYPEAKNAWVYLLRTGKFKTYRGGTVSFSSNSGGKNGLSPNTTAKTESTDETPSTDQKCFSREKLSKIVRNSPRTMSFKRKKCDKHPNYNRYVNRCQNEKYECSWNGRHIQYRHNVSKEKNNKNDSVEMHGAIDKNRKNEINAFKWRHPHQYNEETRIRPSSRQRSKIDDHTITIEFAKVKLKKKLDGNTDNGDSQGLEPIRGRSTSLDFDPNHPESHDKMLMATYSRALDSHWSHEDKLLSSASDSIKERRSMSLDVGSSPSTSHFSGSRGGPTSKREQNSSRDSVFLEIDEGVHSDAGSSSTDVDDCPLESSYAPGNSAQPDFH